MKTYPPSKIQCQDLTYKEFGSDIAILKMDATVIYATRHLTSLFNLQVGCPFWKDINPKGQEKVKKAITTAINKKHAKCEINGTDKAPLLLLDFYFNGESLFVSLVSEEAASYVLLSQEKLASINKIADGIAHNFRSPLMALKSMADYIGIMTIRWKIEHKELAKKCNDLSCEISEYQHKMISMLCQIQNDINSTVDLMSDIVDGLRIYNRSSRVSGYIETDVVDLLSKVIKLLEYNAHDAVKITLEKPQAPMPLFWCIPSDLQLVFVNIIENSIQQIEKRGVLKGIVQLKVGYKNGNIVIIIRDNGGGIEQQLLDKQKLFEPFTTNKQEGSGLGLFVSAKTVAAHGGEIIARNYPAKKGVLGAEFVVTLPIMI